MLVNLDFESDVPIYEQLKNEMIIGIAKKQLVPGERLPSVRALASDIGINLHTVNKAYQQLKQEGFLQIHRQRGVVIHPDGPPLADDVFKQTLTDTMEPMLAAAIAKGMSKKQLEALFQQIYTSLEEDA